MTKESMTWLTLTVDQLNSASYNPRKALKKGDKEYEKNQTVDSRVWLCRTYYCQL